LKQAVEVNSPHLPLLYFSLSAFIKLIFIFLLNSGSKRVYRNA
jgi:hypothetical protein